MTVHIDEIDRAILDELQRDARRPNKALADRVGVSPSTMVNRIRSLEDRDVVRGYHASVAPAALGRSIEAMVSVRLQPKTPAAVEEFIDSVWALDETIAVSFVSGAFDVLVHLSVPDMASLSEIVLSGIASAPIVVDEQTSMVFDHRRKPVLKPLV